MADSIKKFLERRSVRRKKSTLVEKMLKVPELITAVTTHGQVSPHVHEVISRANMGYSQSSDQIYIMP